MLTSAQSTAIARAKDILREHFDGSVIIVRADAEDNDSDEHVEATYHGGYAAAVGAVEIARHRLMALKSDE